MTIQEASMDIHSQSKHLQDLKFREQSMGKLIEKNKQPSWGEKTDLLENLSWTDGCYCFLPLQFFSSYKGDLLKIWFLGFPSSLNTGSALAP